MAQEEIEQLKLLVVDDETDNLDLLYRTFRHEFTVYRANSAFGALQLLEQEGEMSIIISDQRMPKMKGTELLSRIAEHFPDTIRIVLTGYTDVEDLVDAINTGQVFKYITKPWNPTELRNVVQQASETYRAIKRRTGALNRALRRESVFNAMITAIRESLDYRQILETTVKTLGQTFQANVCVLIPVQPRMSGTESYMPAREQFMYRLSDASRSSVGSTDSCSRSEVELEQHLQADVLIDALHYRHAQVQLVKTSTRRYAQLVTPLIYQQEALAVLALYKEGDSTVWTVDDQELIDDVAEQAALAISQSNLYQRTQEQTEQMRAELAVAQQIQTNLLRQTLPDVDTVNIQACCYPAREVGGDFFEVYAHPNGDIWLAVGDVSGKGVPAALFMSSTISVMRRELAQEVSPEPNDLLSNLNTNLLDGLVSSNCFITLAIARYTPSTQTLVYANAGHIFPMLWSTHNQELSTSQKTHHPCSTEPRYLHTRGVPLGILPHWHAQSETLVLQSGDVFLMASDGITEARVLPTLFMPSVVATPGAPGEINISMAQHRGDRTHYAEQDFQMLRQQGLWRLISDDNDSLDLEKLLRKIRGHSLGQEDDQTILSMEIL